MDDDAVEFCKPWRRLRNIQAQGDILIYVGRGAVGKIGMAQASVPLTTGCHYFEVEILDTGLHGYIAVGLTRGNYPESRLPGWHWGSIAYHADDGKVFCGEGDGVPFGPSCDKGDRLGCGIIFPCGYVSVFPSNDDVSPEVPRNIGEEIDEDWLNPPSMIPFHVFAQEVKLHACSSSEDGDEGERRLENEDSDEGVANMEGAADDELVEDPDRVVSDCDEIILKDFIGDGNEDFGDVVGCGDRVHAGVVIEGEKSIMVQVFFTVNGKIVGRHHVRIPPGGFYPTVGMMSTGERVRVNLQPLTG